MAILVGMLRKCFSTLLLAVCAQQAVLADTIQLKDKASITGKVLAEKHDQVAVDVGYTVLVIPRSEILKVSKSDVPEPAPKTTSRKALPAEASGSESGAFGETRGAFYTPATKPTPLRAVRDLVNQLGEAVVQVRTPSGLGSGFMLNEDGFLMTNFHVIEGETQISVEVYHQKNGELNRKSYKQVRIIAINKFEDLALLKIC